MEAEKKRNETVFYVILALAVLIAGAAAWFYFSGKKAPEAGPAQISQPVDMSFLQNLEGNYSMKMTSDGETSLTSASVQRIADDRYSVTRVTVYGPMHYSFSFSRCAGYVIPPANRHSELPAFAFGKMKPSLSSI